MQIPYTKTTLANGLDVVVHEDRRLPMVAVNVWYHVGSKNERVGRTGFAHLFEHLMFEGSAHHDAGFFEPLRIGAQLLHLRRRELVDALGRPHRRPRQDRGQHDLLGHAHRRKSPLARAFSMPEAELTPA